MSASGNAARFRAILGFFLVDEDEEEDEDENEHENWIKN